MSKIHGKGTVLKIDDLGGSLVDISAIAKSTKHSVKVDKPVTTSFGNRGVRREVVGLIDGDVIPIGGFFSRTAGTKVHGKSALVLVDQFNLSTFLKTANVSNSAALDETGCFGSTAKERDVPGLFEAKADFNGFYDPAASASWERFKAHVLGDYAVITVVPEGAAAAGAIGNLCEMGKGQFTMADVPADVDKVTPISASAEADDAWDLGIILHPNTAETAAVNSNSVDESAATTEGGVGHLHVLAATGATVTVKIQHSTDDSTWADLITFTSVTGVVKERIELGAAVTVNRYVRCIITGTLTSLTYVVAFSRRGYVYGAAGTYRHLRGLIGRTASSTFEFAPSGTASGKEKATGEARMRSVELAVDAEGIVNVNGELMVTGAPTYTTY